MKTALDLPDELVRDVKILAAQEGRKLKDVVADLLRRGLDSTAGIVPMASSPFVTDPITGLPMIACRHAAKHPEQLTPDKIASILLDQEVAWNHEASR